MVRGTSAKKNTNNDELVKENKKSENRDQL